METTHLIKRLGGLDAGKMPDLLPELGYILNRPLVEGWIIVEGERVLGVYMLQEFPHLSGLWGGMSPEFGASHLVF